MDSGPTVASRLAAALGTVLGTAESPWRLRAWDGSEAGPPGAPVVAVRSPRAVRRLVWAPGELGLARAYVAGDIDIEGDVYATLEAALAPVGRLTTRGEFARPSARQWVDLARSAAALGAIGRPPAPPPEEFRRPRRGRLHSPARDAAAVDPPLRRRQRLLRPGAGPDARLLLRRLDRRGHRPGRRPGGQARPGLPQAGPAARACGCSTSAAAGAAWRCTPRGGTAPTSSASRCPRSRRRWPGSGSPRPGSTTGSRSGSRTTARSTTARSTR